MKKGICIKGTSAIALIGAIALSASSSNRASAQYINLSQKERHEESIACSRTSERGVKVAGSIVLDTKSLEVSKVREIQNNLDNAIVACTELSENSISVRSVQGIPFITLGGYQVVGITKELEEGLHCNGDFLAGVWSLSLKSAFRDRSSILIYRNQLAGKETQSAEVIKLVKEVTKFGTPIRLAGQTAFCIPNTSKSADRATSIQQRLALNQKAVSVQNLLDRALLATKSPISSSVQIKYVSGIPVVTLGGYQIVVVDSEMSSLLSASPALLAEAFAYGLKHQCSNSELVEKYIRQLNSRASSEIETSVEQILGLTKTKSAISGTEQFSQTEPVNYMTSSLPAILKPQTKGSAAISQPSWTTNRSTANQYALFFPIDTYSGGWPNLHNCQNDCQQTAEALAKYGFKSEICPNLTDSQISEKIREYCQKDYRGSASQLCIYFSGHGEFDSVKKKAYLVASNSLRNDVSKCSYISAVDLLTDIDQIACPHILVLLDTCHSGQFARYLTDNYDIVRKGELDMPDLPLGQLLSNFSKVRTRRLLTSVSDGAASEGPNGGNSPFARSILSSLRTLGGRKKFLMLPDIENTLLTKTHGTSIRFLSDQPGSQFFFILKDYDSGEE